MVVQRFWLDVSVGRMDKKLRLRRDFSQKILGIGFKLDFKMQQDTSLVSATATTILPHTSFEV